MQIVEKGTGYHSKWTNYVILRSKAGMKRDHWVLLDTYSDLDDVAIHLKRVKFYNDDHGISNKYKYKVVSRLNIIKDTLVSPKDIMVMRIKHGI
jgi:hypothetical protein